MLELKPAKNDHKLCGIFSRNRARVKREPLVQGGTVRQTKTGTKKQKRNERLSVEEVHLVLSLASELSRCQRRLLLKSASRLTLAVRPLKHKVLTSRSLISRAVTRRTVSELYKQSLPVENVTQQCHGFVKRLNHSPVQFLFRKMLAENRVRSENASPGRLNRVVPPWKKVNKNNEQNKIVIHARPYQFFFYNRKYYKVKYIFA